MIEPEWKAPAGAYRKGNGPTLVTEWEQLAFGGGKGSKSSTSGRGRSSSYSRIAGRVIRAVDWSPDGPTIAFQAGLSRLEVYAKVDGRGFGKGPYSAPGMSHSTCRTGRRTGSNSSISWHRNPTTFICLANATEAARSS